MTLQEALNDLVQSFSQAQMADPHLEARQLVQECLQLTFAQLLSQPDRALSADDERRVRDWKNKRLRGMPLAYLAGHRGFYKYDFHVEPGVLVPRPETELVVEVALRRIDERGAAFAMADLGSGSGCIGLSVLAEMTELRLWALDASLKACEVTYRNALALGVDQRVKIENKRVEEWDPGLQFDLIVANPPYIAEGDPNVDPGVRAHEPAEALFAGEDGLAAVRSWTPWVLRHLKARGIFVCEIGAGQAGQVQEILTKEGFDDIQIDRDLAGIERVLSAIRKR